MQSPVPGPYTGGAASVATLLMPCDERVLQIAPGDQL